MEVMEQRELVEETSDTGVLERMLEENKLLEQATTQVGSARLALMLLFVTYCRYHIWSCQALVLALQNQAGAKLALFSL